MAIDKKQIYTVISVAVLIVVVIVFFKVLTKKETPKVFNLTPIPSPSEAPKVDCNDLRNYNKCYPNLDDGKGA